MNVEKRFIIEPQRGKAFILEKNKYLQVIDIEGKQVADLIAFNRENIKEKLSTGVTLENNRSLFVRKGDWLFSNKYQKMLKVVEDMVGKHDILFPACSPQMFRSQYGIEEYHPNCLENLSKAVKAYGIREEEIPIPFNVFMNTNISVEGEIRIEEPVSNPGDYIELRAEMDLIIGIAACSTKESKTNAFRCTAIEIRVLS